MNMDNDIDKGMLGFCRKKYAKSNSLRSIADFEYILHNTEVIKDDRTYWTLRGYTMVIAGGCRRSVFPATGV